MPKKAYKFPSPEVLKDLGRVSNRDLARRAGVSAPTVARWVSTYFPDAPPRQGDVPH